MQKDYKVINKAQDQGQSNPVKIGVLQSNHTIVMSKDI
jgi:hypothetical protein